MLSQRNAAFHALERTAWQMRAASDELRRLGDEANTWRARGARISGGERPRRSSP